MIEPPKKINVTCKIQQTHLNAVFALIKIPNAIITNAHLFFKLLYLHAKFILGLIEVRVVTLTDPGTDANMSPQSMGSYKMIQCILLLNWFEW